MDFSGLLDGAARARRDLQAAVAALRDDLGVAHAAFRSADPDGWGVGTHPAWEARRRAHAGTDPIVAACLRRPRPVDWRGLDWSGPARGQRADALAHGVGPQGLTVPVRGPEGCVVLLSIADDRPAAAWDALLRARLRDVVLAAHRLEAQARAAGLLPAAPRPLSPREADALGLLALGYARGEVAAILAISPHTLRAYVEGARAKLGAANTTHAVARALAEGHLAGLSAQPEGRAEARPQAGRPAPRAVAAR